MRHVRYLLLLLALLVGIPTQAQYDPTNPDEPGTKPWQLTLKAIPAEAGYFSLNQETRHAEGEQMRLQAYSHNNYQFIRWEDEKGNILSTNSSLDYTMPSANITLVARYEYTPGNPSEPGQASIKRRLMLKTNPEGAGRFNLNSSSDISTGEVVTLRAYNNKNYYFRNWTQDGAIISTSANFAYTMPSHDVTLVANFDYDYQPDSPNEPGQPTNTYYNIYGVRMEAKVGQTVNYPLYLENRGTAVIGFQVDVSLPKGFTTDAKDITLTDRAIGHTLKVEQTTEGTWRINVSGAKVFEDESGQMLILPIHVPDTATIGQVFNISLANGIVVKEGGEQQNVNVRNGSLKILSSDDTQPDSPDYIVADIQTTTSEVLPGGSVVLSWQVKNQGSIAGVGSWTERIYLIGSDGRKVSIGTASFDAKELQSGASVSRSATVTLAQLPGVDGRVDVAITIVPNSNSGELSDLSMNNTTQTDGQPITVGKRLLLTLPNKPQQEGEVTNIRCQLARSGNWSQAETFMLTKIKGDNRILTPETVVVPREQASVYFYLTLANDDLCNTDSVVSLRIEGNGYDAVEGSFIVTDNELMPLRLTASSTEVSEGDTFQLTVTLAQPSEKPLTVSLTSELPKRFRLPASLVIPAGQTIGTVDVTAIDNEIPDGDVSCAFTAYAAGFEPAEAIVILNDNDLPVLELTFTPNKVKENDGPVCITGTLRRLTNIDKKITVRLSDDSDGGLYFSQKELILAKGVQQANFNLGPVDNSTVDGDRQYTITAAVWLSSCSCSASGQAAGSVQAQLHVFDDDGPALTLTSGQATVREGVTTRLTITRNTGTEQSLTVRLSSDHDDLLTYNHTLVIPAGRQSAYVEVTPAANDTQNDSQTIVFTAESEGFSSGTCYVLVTDQTLPDATIVALELADSEVEVGGTTTVSVTIKNVGVSALPARTETNLYMVSSKTILQTFYTQEPLSPGDSVTLTKPLTLYGSPGQKSLYSAVNERKSVVELNYNNNMSVFCPLLVTSPFTANVTTDKTIYKTDEAIHFSGKIEGNIMEGTEVEVYFTEGNARQSLLAVTDSRGNFTCDYSPFSKQVGHFTFGACYPGEDVNTVQGAFDIVGLLRTTSDYITCQVIVGTPYQGDIEIKNPTAIEQHNIQIETVEGYDNISVNTGKVACLSAGSDVKLKYTINATAPTSEQVWQQIKIRIVSDEGAATDVTLFCFCRQAKAQLALNIEELNTTITKGTTREYPVVLTNRGTGNTGKILLSLPKEIQSATATELPSLQQGDSLMMVFNLKTTDDMQIGVPLTGKIGINCENGNGIALPYSILPVSEATGLLTIDVCDEYTYYTDEKPHVEGAKVVVSRPTTGEKMAEGVTNHNGVFSVELMEGYYQIDVTADKHDAWRNYIIVDPGKNNVKVVNLFHEAIRVDWSVTETEVDDEYQITTTVVYETNVPAPVVVTELPDSILIDEMAPGESRLIYAKLTNKGLIAAEEPQLLFPQDDVLIFEPLEGLPARIMPHESITIPIRVTLSPNVVIEDNVAASRTKVARKLVKGEYCFIKVITAYFWICGNDHKWKKYEKVIYTDTVCIEYYREETVVPEREIPNPCSDGFLWLGGSGGQKSTSSTDECTRCKEALYKAATDGFWEALEGIECPVGTLACSARKLISELIDSENVELEKEVLECEKNGLKCIALSPLTKTLQAACLETGVGAVFCSLGVAALQYVAGILTSPFKCFRIGIRENSRYLAKSTIVDEEMLKPVLPSAAEPLRERCYALADEVMAYLAFNNELFGDSVWLESCPVELADLLDSIMTSDRTLIADDLRSLIPDNIDNERFEMFINRINNTFFGTDLPGGKIDATKLSAYAQIVRQEEQKAVDAGFASAYDWMLAELEIFRQNISPGSPSVCAQVTLQIDQSMVMTRQAFRGTLTVINGHEDTAMQDARLNLMVREKANGRVATAHEFQINIENLDGFEGELNLTSGWTLNAQQTGIATVLFIPTKYAAPTEPVKYSIGGTLTYIDPFTGLEITRDLYPVTLTVNPSPDLDLTYLMQRDVYGDDPLTEDVVEPVEPAEFALIINNKGNGEAKNVRMLTEQPKIVDNEKGLLIDFQLVSSQVNGEPATLSFGKTIANNFGTIPAHSQAYGQWWLESSLLGHFTSYEVEATHMTSYVNQNLSLIDTVTIHEMIHGFTDATLLSSKPRRGYLVNDIVDADDLPDVVYFTDATQQPLYISTGNIDRLGNSEYMLTATTKQQGWNYGSVADPTGGKLKLASITRSRDGAELPIDNMWQTSRTLRDAREWLYENRLHYVSWLPESGESYLLKFIKDDVVGIDTPEADGEQNGNIHLRMSGGWLMVTGNFHELRSIELYDLRGVKQLTTALQQQGQTVNISSLPSGVYFVRVNTDQGTCHAKMLKK